MSSEALEVKCLIVLAAAQKPGAPGCRDLMRGWMNMSDCPKGPRVSSKKGMSEVGCPSHAELERDKDPRMLDQHGPGKAITALLLCAGANSFFEEATSISDSTNAAQRLRSAVPSPGSTGG